MTPQLQAVTSGFRFLSTCSCVSVVSLAEDEGVLVLDYFGGSLLY